MLKKPYQLFHVNGLNRYYLLSGDDASFLAVESVVPYGRKMKKEFTQGLKLLPLYAPIQFLLIAFNKVKQKGVKELEGVGEEAIYETVSVEAARMKVAEMTKTVTAESRFDYDAAITCPAAKKFIEDGGYSVLTIENYDSFVKSYWVAKSDRFGKLTIHELVVGGRGKTKLAAMNTFVLDKNIVSDLLLTMYKTELKRDKNTIKKVEDTIKGENENE